METITRTTKTIVLIGIIKFLFMQFSDDFIQRQLAGLPELSTPNTAFKNLLEGLFLGSQGISPYQGDICHQSPLLILLFQGFVLLPDFCTNLLYALVDCYIAYILSKTAEIKSSYLSQSIDKEKNFSFTSFWVALFYLCNPYSGSISLVKSTALFEYAAVASAIYMATLGNPVVSAFWLSVSSFLSFYPVLLLAPIILLVSRNFSNSKAAIQLFYAFVTILMAFFGLSLYVYGKNSLDSTLLFVFKISDLHPNVGLYWYFFMEMFKEFYTFFIVVLQLNVMVFVIPATFKFRNDPLFSTLFILGISTLLKTYPSWGDLGIFLSYFLIYEELFKYLQFQYLSASLLVTGSILSLSFWQLWIISGTGNANFYYAASLVYSLGIMFFLCDLGAAKLRRDIDFNHPTARNKIIYQK